MVIVEKEVLLPLRHENKNETSCRKDEPCYFSSSWKNQLCAFIIRITTFGLLQRFSVYFTETSNTGQRINCWFYYAHVHTWMHIHIDEDTTLMNVNEEDLKRAPNTLLICEEEWRLRYVFRVVLKHPFPCTSWVTFTLFLSSHNVLQFLEQTILKYLFYKYSFYALYPLAGMLRSFNFGFPNACELDIRDAYILSFSIYSENIFIHIIHKL